MMEQTHTGKGHNHTVFVTFFNDQVIPDGTAGFGNILHTGGICTLNIIVEWEKGIGA